jgi:Nickel responsive protein SCO4226-like
MLRKFVIEREVPGIGGTDLAGMGEAAKVSNGALARLEGIQWQHSYVTADKTFCIYLAESEDLIREHARLSGFPANTITEVTEVIDPTTERQCAMATPARLAAAV